MPPLDAGAGGLSLSMVHLRQPVWWLQCGVTRVLAGADYRLDAVCVEAILSVLILGTWVYSVQRGG